MKLANQVAQRAASIWREECLSVVFASCLSLELSLPALGQAKDLSEEESSRISVDWSKALRGFRSDHNFSVSLGVDGSNWRLVRGDNPRFSVASQSLRSEVSYSFHLPLLFGIGYYLGTTFGVRSDRFSGSELSSYYSILLPGLDLGVVWNVANNCRINAGYSFSWQRLDSLKITDLNDGVAKSSLTGEAVSYRAGLDYFFNISEALRVEYEQLTFFYSSPSILDLEINGRSVKLGYLKHLL